MTKLEVRLVRNMDLVTDPIFLPAFRCRSMQNLLATYDLKLKRVNYRAWNMLHGTYMKDTLPTVFLGKTVGKGSNLWVEAQWNQPGTYSRWFNRNIESGQNSGASVKVEIHVTVDYVAAGLAEYLGRIDDPTEEELEKERLEEAEKERIPATKRPYKRVEYLFEEWDLIEKKQEERGMWLPAMTPRARRERYAPKGKEFDPGSHPWFKGETDTEANYFEVQDGDDDDEDDEEEEEEMEAVDEEEWEEEYEDEDEEEEEDEGDAMDIDG
ncbi:hypothetical protein Z517_01752 [Fonsecaea pedrosoi CBS 271.37]|uniref:Uncharacterized protein n=1 Tax=Fonsecaea pedrosoi CBS 271.37 TaxID=1442368 RepID=A0A0D2E871_9EURO|nr:uncharacterized protein Z517_01752 [Fonsecaea pedrosoi CBS 271.37]KIW86356.1 hypothetical protein Z517_01752 [Fonsecaea pedrosoi CBS 271.37]